MSEDNGEGFARAAMEVYVSDFARLAGDPDVTREQLKDLTAAAENDLAILGIDHNGFQLLRRSVQEERIKRTTGEVDSER